MVFQRCELRALPAPQIFRRSQQSSTDVLPLVPTAYRDLGDTAVDDFSVHSIQRLFESGIYETNDLTIELRDESDALSARPREMLPSLSVALRYRLKRADQILFRINA